MRFLVLAIALAGCQPRPDGASCDEHADCESELCIGGICTGSQCYDTGDCEAGWDCLGEGSAQRIRRRGSR